jgi:hypothetical protein
MRFFAKKSDFDQKTDDSQTFRSLLSTRQRVDVGDLPYRQKDSLANSKYINPKK